ncbi:MAG TPA: SAM-dependent methyltransferase [Kribbellaceae bacterium]|nr:SAM-dependent methyltransferase [Kribbellaceae bacterium]
MIARVPSGVDVNVASASRVYDFYLGGSHHFGVDRVLAEQVLLAAPWVREVAHSNRAFLRRVVRYLVAEAGVRQFLDLGSGIPTVGNVHEIAQGLDVGCRVVYVDIDPVAVAHSEQLLAGNRRATVIEADVRDPAAILTHPRTLSMLDFDQPMAVLMISVLLFVTDEEGPAELVARYVSVLAPGSYLAISHGSTDDVPPRLRAQIDSVAAAYEKAGQPVIARGRAEITSWFTGLELIDPRVVALPHWRPDSDHTDSYCTALGYGGLGRTAREP